MSSFQPRAQEEILRSAIMKKRDAVNAGETTWTSEAPGDFGVTLLNLNSFLISESEANFGNRLKQVYIQNARNPEAVWDAARHLGYKPRTPVSAVVPIEAKSTGTTQIGDKAQIKVATDNGYVYLEALGSVSFAGAEVRKFFAVEGKSTIKEEISDGSKFQIYYIPSKNVDSNSVMCHVGGLGNFTAVPSFIDSNNASKHFICEFDYFHRPIVIFGDGIKGIAPPAGVKITFGYRVSKGSAGNVPQGYVELVEPVANIDYLKTKLPADGTLAEEVSTTSTSLTLVSNEAIDVYPSTGVAYVGEDYDQFSYTGISGDTFTGVTGLTATHLVGETVRFADSPIKGEDAESLDSIVESAQFYNLVKQTCIHENEFSRVVKDVKGVLRGKAYNIGHSTLVQVVPTYGGYPNKELLEAVQKKLNQVSGVRNPAKAINPKYVHIESVIRFDVLANQSWNEVVKPLAESIIQAYLSPLTVTNNGRYFYTSWGATKKISELVYLFFTYMGGRYIGNLYIDRFCRQGGSGAVDVGLADDEIASVGTILVLNNESSIGS